MVADQVDTEIGVSSENLSNNHGVYIYRPADLGKSHGERPSKRRKVVQEVRGPSKDLCPFVPLLNGDEVEKSVQLRYQTYQQLWSAQEAKIKEVLDDVDAGVLENVSSFVKSTSSETFGGCIPAALITVGSNVSSLARLLARLNDQLKLAGEGVVIVLESGDAPNLKTTLKNIIRAAIINTEGNDGYQSFLNDREGPRLLGYDLDLLGDYVTKKDIKNLVLAFRDSEAFDPGILTDLFFLLREIPRSSVALLKGRYFEIHEASNCVDRIYERIQAEDGKFWLGRNITGILFEKSNDYFQTPESFARTVKYAYMSHFFANPLSVLLANDFPSELQQQSNLCEAIRNLPSFQEHCEILMEEGSTKLVRSLLEDDSFLFQHTLQILRSGQQSMCDMFQAVKFLHVLFDELNVTKRTNVSELCIRALSGELQDSPMVDDILTAFKPLDSTKVGDLLTQIPESVLKRPEFQKLQTDLTALTQAHKGPEPLRSEYDSQNSVMGTTIVQQRVKLNKGKAKLPEECIKYTKVMDRLHALLKSYFSETLLTPQELPMHEVFLLDMRNPLKEIFSPRPRFAIERALSNPFDYLMSTSQAAEGKISTAQPATAILYQLYLESSALVNVHDLWQAFRAVFESEQGDSCDERMTMTLFYRAVSELRALGMLKTSRKKVDHAAKSAWMGL
ncbi:hypothetical protein AOCH_005591 [Aspergillus ochraceoroseus]|uniref:Uncharacterized protein n=1 Tax=Aspergillus ochraceoroseus TaxID=138278 RepID=A0A0F8UEE2_9EURO|nr:hypothetical protein AOCH_005591 [Aspergillus ochraceoroseus]